MRILTMTNNSDKIEIVKMKLKSAMKLKLNNERELCQARYRERSLNELLASVKAENEFLKEQLEDVKSQMAQARHQTAVIEICSSSEKCKVEAHIANLEHHKKGFQELFSKERDLFDLRMKEISDKKAEEEEVLRQKEREIAEKREQEVRVAATVEAECETLERECTVLKKRNNAIMLQLRRKLLETENARRERAKRNDTH